MRHVDLSIIILNYNTSQLTLDAISSIEKNYAKEVETGTFEVIVADNASTDGSLAALKEYKKKSKIQVLDIIDNGANIGFAAGNNKGVVKAAGKYVLFLNPDTIVHPKTLRVMLDFMEKNLDVGAASCKLVNKDGKFDFNSHRGFPTPWNAFCYFSGLGKLFPKSRIFAGYTQGWKNFHTTHEVDAIEGAFMFVPRTVGEKVGWWDEDYFFYGEDLQFCYDIKNLGLKIYYVGEVEIMHIGGAASGIKQKKQIITSDNIDARRKIQKARFDAMRIFYKKNYKNVYPSFIQWLVIKAIEMKEKKILAGLRIPSS